MGTCALGDHAGGSKEPWHTQILEPGDSEPAKVKAWVIWCRVHDVQSAGQADAMTEEGLETLLKGY